MLFAGTLAYVAALPPNLGAADEASYLHEATRLLDGEVMYRDVFDFVTPGFQYLMAFLFDLFGTTITTARITAGAIHGLTVLALYATCRRVGVRPWLAGAAGLLHLGLDQPAWPIASQHWLSTLLCTTLLWTWSTGVRTASDAARGGLVVGLLAAVQQQRAVPMAVGAAVWLVADPVLARAWGGRVEWSRVGARLAAFGLAVAAVVVPVLAWCVARAGFAVVWEALVVFPFRSYGANTHCPWGHVNVMTAWLASFTFPRVLTWLPAALAITAGRLVHLGVVGRDEATARRLGWLLVFALASMVSILYFPDFIHIAFIAPAFYVAVAENVEAATRLLGAPAGRVASAMVALLAAAGIGGHLARNMERAWAACPWRARTRFGVVQFCTEPELRLYEAVRRLTEATPGVELLVHPAFSHLYLTTGARNPTRYTWYASTFAFPDLLADVETRQPPYAVLFLDASIADPVAAYVRRAYEPIVPGESDTGTVLRRRAP
jgi:hypothetical protein